MTQQVVHLRTRRKGPKRGLRYKAGSRAQEKRNFRKAWKKATKILNTEYARITAKTWPPPLGFLVPQLIDSDLLTHKRWDWHLKNIANNRITLPIPQITFDSMPNPEVKKMLITMMKTIESEGQGTAGERLIEWFVYGFGSKDSRFPSIQQKTHEELMKQLKLKEMMNNPYDWAAVILIESRHRVGPGWFATPMGISKMMTEMLMQTKDKPWESVNEPAIGTGGMLLPMSNYSLNMKGQDISYTAIIGAKMNFFLYVPWILMPYKEPLLKNLENEYKIKKMKEIISKGPEEITEVKK